MPARNSKSTASSAPAADAIAPQAADAPADQTDATPDVDADTSQDAGADTEVDAEAPLNRAERRAKGKKGGQVQAHGKAQPIHTKPAYAPRSYANRRSG